jgi:transcription antitermination factor NusG
MSHLQPTLHNSSGVLSTLESAFAVNSHVANDWPWFAIRTRSNHERTAAAALSGKGYESYVPLYTSRKRWSDRTVEIQRPLFTGYVFCRFNAKARMPVLTTPGVISVIGFGNEPAPVDDAEIEAIEAVLRSGFSAEPCAFLREGQRIRVTNGSLAGLEGLLVRKKTEWRMVVSVTMLQRSISVEIDREWIEPAS